MLRLVQQIIGCPFYTLWYSETNYWLHFLYGVGQGYKILVVILVCKNRLKILNQNVHMSWFVHFHVIMGKYCRKYDLMTVCTSALSSGHLVPSHLGLAYVLLIATNPFPELVVIFPDYSLQSSLGTFSILLDHCVQLNWHFLLTCHFVLKINLQITKAYGVSLSRYIPCTFIILEWWKELFPGSFLRSLDSGCSTACLWFIDFISSFVKFSIVFSGCSFFTYRFCNQNILGYTKTDMYAYEFDV